MIQENPLSGGSQVLDLQTICLNRTQKPWRAGTVLLTDETPNRCVRRVLAMNITTLLTYHLARVVKALTLGRQNSHRDHYSRLRSAKKSERDVFVFDVRNGFT
jgi:hypothetical protein